MAEFFDEAAWRATIAKPDWYIKLYPELKELRKQWEADQKGERSKTSKREVRAFFEQALTTSEIALADHGPNLDAERKSIDTIIIHHTSSKPGYSLSYMNAVHLLNIYVPYFNNPSESIPGEANLKGSPLWSNHVRDGRPVFYAYHWFIRMDGSFERLLNDDELGWHAANWDINCRSIAICLDNDYDQHDPTPETLHALAKFINEHYAQISSDRILGHGEVSRHPTTCPGKNFVGGWKQALLDQLK